MTPKGGGITISRVVAGPSLRARKKEATRHAIATVALDLFERRGFAATTVDDVAAAAGVSARTFFRYFASKEEVVFADQAERLDALTECLRSQPPGPVRTRLAGAVVGFAAWIEQGERQGTLARSRIIRDDEALLARTLLVARTWEEVLAAAVAADAGRAEPGLPDRALANAAVGALMVAMREWRATGPAGGLAPLARHAFDTLGWS